MMFERISTGWQLARQSLHVLKLDRELLLLPVFSGLACLLVLASFAVPLYGTDYLSTIADDAADTGDLISLVILFAFYTVNYFVIIYFNSALVACAVIRFKGGDPSVGDGLRAASARLPQILGWALVSATVGVVLRVLESQSEKAGQFAAALLGMAWSVTTYFVVPVLVVEKAGPMAAFSRSTKIMTKTWGESLSAEFSLGFFNLIMVLPGVAVAVAGGFLLATGSTTIGAVVLVVGIALLVLAALITTAVGTILQAAIYLYATDGEIPAYFDQRLVSRAFA